MVLRAMMWFSGSEGFWSWVVFVKGPLRFECGMRSMCVSLLLSKWGRGRLVKNMNAESWKAATVIFVAATIHHKPKELHPYTTNSNICDNMDDGWITEAAQEVRRFQVQSRWMKATFAQRETADKQTSIIKRCKEQMQTNNNAKWLHTKRRLSVCGVLQAIGGNLFMPLAVGVLDLCLHTDYHKNHDTSTEATRLKRTGFVYSAFIKS